MMPEAERASPSYEEDYGVEAIATIEGHPDSVLRELLASKASTKRSVKLRLELRKPPNRYWETHWLPIIANGDTSAAREHLRLLFRQGFLSVEAESRIALLIDSFGRATK